MIIEDDSSRLLVVKAHYKPYWSLPGGWIDKGDTPLQAAVREVREELGITVDSEDLDLFFVVDRVSKLADTYLFVFKLSEPVSASDIGIQLQANEIAEYDWVTRQDVLSGAKPYSAAVKNWAAPTPKAYIERRVD